MRQHRLLVWFFSVFMLMLSSFNTAVCQNNPYKIDDRLFPIYLRAFNNRAGDKGVLSADTLRKMSVLYGDKKAECLAYTIYLLHASAKSDEQGIVKAMEDLKVVSRRNGYLQYYYFGPSIYIIYLLNMGKSLQAMQENTKLEKEAIADNSQYGILTCLKSMARIQTARGNHSLAFKYNQMALDYMLKNAPEQDPTSLYREMSEYKRACGEYDEAISYIDKAIASSKTINAKERSLQQKCRVLYYMNRYDEFYKCYDEFLELSKKVKADTTDVFYIAMMICKSLIEKDTEKALMYADSNRRSEEAHLRRSRIYEAVGDYKNAFYEYKTFTDMNTAFVESVQASDIAELNVQMGNQVLQNRLKEQQEETMSLKLHQAEQEVEMEEERARVEHLKVTNQQLELDRLKSERKLLDSENERQKIELEKQESMAKYHNKVVGVVAVATMIVFAGMSFVLVHHRVMLKKLAYNNKELAVARDQADSANKMKTVFIQNMSHEIRTPLNAIVGFSQILTTPDMALSPEDSQEYAQVIRHNSELLTSLVNDLLGLAELESSKYSICREPVNCKELCAESVATVSFRKNEGVELRCTADVPDDYMLYTDSRRVKQVLINYLTNAAKHTKEGFIELHCSLTENPGKITFSVTDTGSGIAPEDVGKLFQRFEKLDSFEPGFGLGLSICAAVAERLDGEVRLDTSYTNGARFLFIIPVEEIPAEFTAAMA